MLILTTMIKVGILLRRAETALDRVITIKMTTIVMTISEISREAYQDEIEDFQN